MAAWNGWALGLVGVAAVGLTAGGCGSRIEGQYADRVLTEAEPGLVMAGENVVVTCSVLAGDGGRADIETAFDVLPVEGRTVTDEGFVPTVAGVFRVNCYTVDEEIGLRDEEGVDVSVVGAPPVRVTTVLQQETVQVYEPTGVLCLAEDAFGNAVPVDATVEADEGAVTSDDDGEWSVVSEVIGQYEVRCVPAGDSAAAEVAPATLDVTAGDPAFVDLTINLSIPNYQIGQKIVFKWEVQDAYGNVLEDVPATFTAPDEGVVLDDPETNKWQLLDEGVFTFTVTLDPPYELLTDSETLVVDATGPSILLPWPERGEQIQGDGGFVELEGVVGDALGIVAEFTIGGVDVPLEPDGSFVHTIIPEWGTNTLLVVAEDEYGNATRISPSFHYSQGYTSFEDASAQGLKTEDALALLIGQDFLDDGDHDPNNIDDLATILEVLLSGIDLKTLFTDLANLNFEFPLFSFPLDLGILELELSGVANVGVNLVEPTDIGPTFVTLDSRIGGLDLAIEMGDAVQLALDLSLEAAVDLTITFAWDLPFIGAGDLAAGAAATLTSGLTVDNILVQTKIDIAKALGGDLQLELQQIELGDALENLQIDPIEDVELEVFTDDLPLIGSQSFTFALSDLLDINALTDAILDPLTTSILPLLGEVLEPLIETFAGDLLGGLFDLIEFDTSFELPALFGDKPEPTFLDIYTNLTSVQFDEEGGQIGLSLGAYADKGIDREPIGAIRREGCLTNQPPASFDYDWQRSVGAAFKTDAINALLFAVWWSGFLNGPVDLSSLLGDSDLPIPIDDIVLDLGFLLPPVLNDCGSKGIIELEVGDLFAKLEGNLLGFPITAELYLDVALSVVFGASDEGLTVQIGDFGVFDVEVMSISEEIQEFFDLRDLLENGLQGLLEGFIVGETFGPIALPELDLGGLVPGLPENLAFEIGNLAIFKQDGYVVGGADLK